MDSEWFAACLPARCEKSGERRQEGKRALQEVSQLGLAVQRSLSVHNAEGQLVNYSDANSVAVGRAKSKEGETQEKERM